MKKQNQMSQSEIPEIQIPAEITAKIAGVSESLVKQVRTGQRSGEKGAGFKAAFTDDLLRTGANKLIEEVKRVVKFKQD